MVVELDLLSAMCAMDLPHLLAIPSRGELADFGVAGTEQSLEVTSPPLLLTAHGAVKRPTIVTVAMAAAEIVWAASRAGVVDGNNIGLFSADSWKR